ncbi:TPA: phage tail protein [Vibrio parahaemolyticus]
MANTTDKSILTAAGKALLAQLNAEEKPLIIDKMIFANVPNRPEFPQPDDVVPTDDIVHQEQVEQRGRLSADSVIYSTTLTSDVGPFEFNWTGAYCSEYGVLVTIDHHALTPKTADEPGVAGNTLVRSVVLEYKDIAEITNITVDASSWQYNATDRMKKMDSDVAQSIIDQNGKDWFIEDGFLVTPSGNAYNIKAGASYVSGNRVSMEFDRSVQVPNKPSFIYIDAHREGTPTGEQITLFDFVITDEEKDDYIDSSTGKDIPHFVCKIAEVLADGSVSDLRPEGEKEIREKVAGKPWEIGKLAMPDEVRVYTPPSGIPVSVYNSASEPVVMGAIPDKKFLNVTSKSLLIDSFKLISIPSDFDDLQSAIDSVAAMKASSRYGVIINIESGHKLSSGIVVRGGDFSHITITSTDDVVRTSDTFIGEDPTFIPERLRASVTNKFFCIVSEGARSPAISFLLDLELKPCGGILVAEGDGCVLEGYGFEYAGDRGYLIHGRGNFYGAVGRYCAKTAVRTQQAAQVVLRNFDGTGSCSSPDQENESALYLSRSTICELRGAKFPNSGGHGAIARRCLATADEADFSGAAKKGVFAESGTMFTFSGGKAENCGQAAIDAATGARILAGGSNLGTLLDARYTMNLNGGHILLNSGSTLNGEAATESLARASSNAPYLNAFFSRGVLEFTDGIGTFDVGTENGGRYELKSNGRFETRSTTQVYDITVLSGDFSDRIPLPPVPLPDGITIEEIDFFNIEAVGRTSTSAGGNRVAVAEFNRFPSDGTGNEFRIKNEGVQLDGDLVNLTINSIEYQVKIEGRYTS